MRVEVEVWHLDRFASIMSSRERRSGGDDKLLSADMDLVASSVLQWRAYFWPVKIETRLLD